MKRDLEVTRSKTLVDLAVPAFRASLGSGSFEPESQSQGMEGKKRGEEELREPLSGRFPESAKLSTEPGQAQIHSWRS